MAKKNRDIKIKHDATCISNKRGQANRAKTQSNKTDRQMLSKLLRNNWL
jgi:hypothetical protein